MKRSNRGIPVRSILVNEMENFAAEKSAGGIVEEKNVTPVTRERRSGIWSFIITCLQAQNQRRLATSQHEFYLVACWPEASHEAKIKPTDDNTDKPITARPDVKSASSMMIDDVYGLLIAA